MSTNKPDEEFVLKAIQRQIESEVQAAMEKVIPDAKNKIEDLLRKEIANISMTLLKHFTIEYGFNNEIIIRVQDMREKK